MSAATTTADTWVCSDCGSILLASTTKCPCSVFGAALSQGDQGTGSKGTLTEGKRSRKSGPLATAEGAGGPLATRGPLATDGPLATGEYSRLDLTRSNLEAVVRMWGGDGLVLPCPLPGHEGEAAMVSDGDGALLRCCGGRLRPLGEVRAARAYGVDKLRTNIEGAVWVRRLAFEVDAFHPVAVELPPVPAGSPPAVSRAASGFGLLVGLRWADGPRRPVAYSTRFAEAWTAIPYRAVTAALGVLRRSGVIVPAGKAGTGALASTLYLPGRLDEEEPW